LISNAIKHPAAGSVVEIEQDSRGEQLRVLQNLSRSGIARIATGTGHVRVDLIAFGLVVS